MSLQGVARAAGVMEELLFNTPHGLIDQSLHSSLGAERANGDGFEVGWYGAGEGPGMYHSVAPAWGDTNLRELAAHIEAPIDPAVFADFQGSTDSEVIFRLAHPENQWLQRLADEDRVVVSEPVVDLPGAWDEIPEACVLVVQPGAHELRPFRSHLEAGDVNGAQTLDLSTA